MKFKICDEKIDKVVEEKKNVYFTNRKNITEQTCKQKTYQAKLTIKRENDKSQNAFIIRLKNDFNSSHNRVRKIMRHLNTTDKLANVDMIDYKQLKDHYTQLWISTNNEIKSIK